MITLITGAPGAGKTSLLVELLLTIYRQRLTYVSGIPDLTLEHFPLEDPRRWHVECPDGSLVVIDEVQRVWRPAGSGQKIPDDIAMLETHRHRGFDFILLTQRPNLLHSNVRGLVGRHIHLRDVGALGRWWYEWPECGSVDAFKSAPIKKRYRIAKEAWKHYKSASMHVRPVRSVPPALVALGVLVPGLIGGVYYAYSRISERVEVATGAAPPDGAASAPQGGTGAPGAAAPGAPIGSAYDPSAFIPADARVPSSAPAYDHLRQVVSMPRIIGGYCVGSRCWCFTQQGTDAGLGSDGCRDWIANRPFDPYRPDPVHAGPGVAPPPPPPGAYGAAAVSQAPAAIVGALPGL